MFGWEVVVTSSKVKSDGSGKDCTSMIAAVRAQARAVVAVLKAVAVTMMAVRMELRWWWWRQRWGKLAQV